MLTPKQRDEIETVFIELFILAGSVGGWAEVGDEPWIRKLEDDIQKRAVAYGMNELGRIMEPPNAGS